MKTYPDISKLKGLEYEPKISIEEALKDTIQS